MRATLVVRRPVVSMRLATVAPTVLRTAGVQGIPGPLIEDLQQTLTFGSTITIDLSELKEVYDVTVTGPCTLEVANGSTTQDGKKLMLRVQQTGGPHAITFGASFSFPSEFSSIPFTGTTGVRDYVGFCYFHPSAVADIVSYVLGHS